MMFYQTREPGHSGEIPRAQFRNTVTQVHILPLCTAATPTLLKRDSRMFAQ